MKHTVCQHVNRLPHLGTVKGGGSIFAALLLKIWFMTHQWIIEDSKWVANVLQMQKKVNQLSGNDHSTVNV